MKELSIEEKARRYNEAIERANSLLSDNQLGNAWIYKLLPELKDNDKEIRKELISMCQTLGKAEWIAWLEKQGEQKPAMIQWKGDNLKEVVDFAGVYKEGLEKWFHNSLEEYEKYVHEHNNILKMFNEDGSHMEVPVGSWIIKAPDGYNTASRFGFVPKSDGWSNEDDIMKQHCHQMLALLRPNSSELTKDIIDNCHHWLKSIKSRVQPKIEWSERDELMLEASIGFIESSPYPYSGDTLRGEISKNEVENWLKSLRPQKQWKPSDEQLDSLYDVLNPCDGFNREVLESLYVQLKKLREE